MTTKYEQFKLLESVTRLLSSVEQSIARDGFSDADMDKISKIITGAELLLDPDTRAGFNISSDMFLSLIDTASNDGKGNTKSDKVFELVGKRGARRQTEIKDLMLNATHDEHDKFELLRIIRQVRKDYEHFK